MGHPHIQVKIINLKTCSKIISSKTSQIEDIASPIENIWNKAEDKTKKS